MTSTGGSSTASRPRATTCSGSRARVPLPVKLAVVARHLRRVMRRLVQASAGVRDGGGDDRLPAGPAGEPARAGAHRASWSPGWRWSTTTAAVGAVGSGPHRHRRCRDRHRHWPSWSASARPPGVPFGRYRYTGRLRPDVAGVPVVVPMAWWAMAVPAREAAHAALGRRSTAAARIVARGRRAHGVGPLPRSADDRRGVLALARRRRLPGHPARQLRRLVRHRAWP